MSKYDLLDYGLAKEIVKDLPKLREIFENTKNSLEPYKKYRDAAQIIDKLEDAIIFLDLQLEVYQQKVKLKGKIDEQGS
jgi:hypothetical protein